MKRILIFLLFTTHLWAAPGRSYTISKIKIKSSLIGKDRFVQYYLNEVGDHFDESQHKRSVSLIHDELVNDGYLKAAVTDALVFDDQRKSVAVTIYVVPGDRYKISDISLFIEGAVVEEALKYDILSEFEGQLVGSYFIKDLIETQSKRLRSFLVRMGYVDPEIAIKKEVVDGRHQLALIFGIKLSKRHEFRFEGNFFFKSSELLEDVLALEEQGVSLPPALIAQDIEDLYMKKGFMSVKVAWREELNGITFTISEGARHVIDEVKIKENFTQSQPLGRIQKLESSLRSQGAYDEELVEKLLADCSADLADLGYWYIVLDKAVSRSKKASRVDIVVTASQTGSEKGVVKRTEIQNIEIPRYTYLASQAPFASWCALKEPYPITPREIEIQKSWLLRFLNQAGYLTATVSYRFELSKEGAVLIWDIDDRAGPVHVGKVAIKGLSVMRPFIIQRELCFHEGDIWNGQSIEESVQRLTELCMFESIAVRPQPIVQKKGPKGEKILERPLIVTCVEDDPFELRTRFGVQFVSKSFTNLSWTTWKLGGSFIWKNPSGYADRVILDADWTRYTLNLAASYEIPWLGPVPIRTLFKAYSDRFDQPLISSNHHRLYTESHDGASIQFYHSHPWWTTCVRIGTEGNKVAGISRRLASVIQFEPTLVDRRIPYIYVEPSVIFEHFDNKTDPTKGFFSSCSLKAMVPPGITDGWFIKILLEQSFFYPLYESVIGALRWRFGHIFNAKFSTILPTERFYLGGANSLRGYETNMAPPLNDVECDGKCIWVPVGGKTMANINAELRFPLYRRLSGVLFTDMGILTQDRFADIAANKWLGATGFGLRLASPIGPIRFDIGWKWKKRDPRDKAYAFFFTFGHAF